MKNEEIKDVVIIGAGLAGLAAGQRLLEAGRENIIVLEAQDRVGGRIHTHCRDGGFFELGAQWLHGAEENPLYKWLADKNLLEHPEEATAEMQGLFASSNRQVIDRKVVDKVFDTLLCAKDSLSNMSQDDAAKLSDLKAISYFKKYFDDSLLLLSKNCDSYEDQYIANTMESVPSNVFDALFKWFALYETIDNSASSINDVSIKSYLNWSNLGDGVLINFKRGYQSLVDCLADELTQKSLIKTSCETVKIRHFNADSRSLLQVEYLDISDCDKVTMRPGVVKLKANCVIFTASLAVLKDSHLKMFEPSLSQQTQQIISSLGFGTVNKIFLEFDEPILQAQKGLKLVWLPTRACNSAANDCDNLDHDHHNQHHHHHHQKQAQKEEEAKSDDQLPEWTKFITGFDLIRDEPRCLLGWIGGVGAVQMETFSDKEIGDACLRLIERFVPTTENSFVGTTVSTNLPKLRRCICSRWSSNKFVKGAYSYQSLASYSLPDSNSNNDDGGFPAEFDGKLLFAGEATAGKLYSTTAGAVFSGWRAANKFIQMSLKSY